MGLFERVMTYVPSGWRDDALAARQLSVPDETLPAFIGRLTARAQNPVYRLPSVRQSMGVPAIEGAVSLIAGTTGMLTVEGFRDGAEMETPPRLIARPDPYNTPQQFYSLTASQMAKYGEFVWFIATRDGDGLPAALIPVPLQELQVQENQKNRLFPAYTWGTVTSTRYSPANTAGRFVHVKYPLAEPFALRGSGPLQLCGAATSVTVEAQDWAANFYAEGGKPSDVIKKAGILGSELDADGNSEADRLRSQWIGRAHNTVRVIDDNIADIQYREPSVAGAQMLEARQHQNGDAARMFRIPGSLLEYQQPGASLTYQNLEGEFTKFVRTCLQPLYLEPMEQALSDLLPRSTAARFNIEGFLRADIRTRFDVHKIAIEAGIYDPAYAQEVEGIAPGDVEFAPIPFAPPAAVPATVPRAASMLNVRCPKCNKLLARALGPGSEVECGRCKTPVSAPLVDEPKQFAIPRIDVNLPAPAPLNLRVDMATESGINGLRDQIAALDLAKTDLERAREADLERLNGQLADLAKRNDELAREIAAPRPLRKFIPTRDATGRIVAVDEVA